MTDSPPPNGDSLQQIVIALDAAGNLSVTCPANKIVALGMMTAAQHIIIGTKPPSPVVPVRRIIP